MYVLLIYVDEGFMTWFWNFEYYIQVPLFCGFYSLENVAFRLSRFLGKTGKHLFLTDGKNGKPPLLLQMEEILDETDEYVNIHNKIKFNMNASKEKAPDANVLQPSNLAVQGHTPTDLIF
ncbi:hypothetical protein TSUD_308340 [Trifolium subterraneum]|nr:hypothetical protein TSUD_308340 [Trifolium subterraneum]